MTKREGGGINGKGLVAKVLMSLTIASLLALVFCCLSEQFLYTVTWMCYKSVLLMCIMRKWLQQTRPQSSLGLCLSPALDVCLCYPLSPTHSVSEVGRGGCLGTVGKKMS